MEMTGEQRIAAPRQRVWEALNDPEVLRACIPGCQSLERDGDNGFAAVAEVKIGPIGARFKGAVALNDLDPPNGYTIEGQGNGGVAGNAKGSAKVRLSDDAGGGTLVSYNVDAQVGGRMAQLGGPIIDATAKQLAGKFFTRFGEIVGGEAPAPAATEAPAAVTAPVAAPAAAPAPFAIPAPAAAQTGAPPWGWITALALAIVVGFMLGRSGAGEWWMILVILALVVAATAGYETGRRSGGRP
jgi:carbon monoxide dehydrogenase subunit G